MGSAHVRGERSAKEDEESTYRSELVRASFEPRVGFSTTSVTVDAEPSGRVVTVTIVMMDGVVTTVWPWLSVTVWTTWLVNVGL